MEIRRTLQHETFRRALENPTSPAEHLAALGLYSTILADVAGWRDFDYLHVTAAPARRPQVAR